MKLSDLLRDERKIGMLVAEVHATTGEILNGVMHEWDYDENQEVEMLPDGSLVFPNNNKLIIHKGELVRKRKWSKK